MFSLNFLFLCVLFDLISESLGDTNKRTEIKLNWGWAIQCVPWFLANFKEIHNCVTVHFAELRNASSTLIIR
jgi:hypothetical protein